MCLKSIKHQFQHHMLSIVLLISVVRWSVMTVEVGNVTNITLHVEIHICVKWELTWRVVAFVSKTESCWKKHDASFWSSLLRSGSWGRGKQHEPECFLVQLQVIFFLGFTQKNRKRAVGCCLNQRKKYNISVNHPPKATTEINTFTKSRALKFFVLLLF